MTDNRYFGAIKDPIDNRDFVASTVASKQKIEIPETYIVPHLDEIPVYNQGGTGSCVAHALATALALGYAQKGIQIDFSRGFIYGNRSEDDYQGSGMIPREALKHLNHEGDVHYSDFIYNFEVPLIFKKFQKEKERLLPIAKDYVIANYYKVTTQTEIKTALMTTGAVVVYCPVYGDFTDDLKAEWRSSYDYAHEVCLVGWDETGWIIRNSWGDSWGNKGNGHVDYKYAYWEEYNLSLLDFWAITPIFEEDTTIEDEEDTDANEDIKEDEPIEDEEPIEEDIVIDDDSSDDDLKEDIKEDDTDVEEEDVDVEEHQDTEDIIEDTTEEDFKEDVDTDVEETDNTEDVDIDTEVDDNVDDTETDTDTDVDDNTDVEDDNKDELLVNDKRFISFVEAIKAIIKQILDRIRNIFNGNK